MIGLFHSFTVYYTKNWRDATLTGNFLEGIQGWPGRTRTCAFTGIAVSSAQAKGGQWQLALSFFEGMLSAQISPDVVTFSASISAINSASWQHSLKFFEQMFMSTLASAPSWCFRLPCEHFGHRLENILVILDPPEIKSLDVLCFSTPNLCWLNLWFNHIKSTLLPCCRLQSCFELLESADNPWKL